MVFQALLQVCRVVLNPRESPYAADYDHNDAAHGFEHLDPLRILSECGHQFFNKRGFLVLINGDRRGQGLLDKHRVWSGWRPLYRVREQLELCFQHYAQGYRYDIIFHGAWGVLRAEVGGQIGRRLIQMLHHLVSVVVLSQGLYQVSLRQEFWVSYHPF